MSFRIKKKKKKTSSLPLRSALATQCLTHPPYLFHLFIYTFPTIMYIEKMKNILSEKIYDPTSEITEISIVT